MQRAASPVNRIVLRLVLSVLLGLSVSTLSHAAERAIDKEITVAASLDDAWSAWTTREGIVSFFAPDAVVDARVGGAFHIHINPLGEPGSKGADDMRFLALQPKQMISFDWNAPPHLPEARAQRTFVIVRFAAIDDKTTKVTLHHTGWGNGGEWDKTFSYFERAWGGVLGNLKKRFETGPVDWTQWLAQLKKMRDDAAAKK
jgi:uncharacterized protein YndB with AHSA1/START domain